MLEGAALVEVVFRLGRELGLAPGAAVPLHLAADRRFERWLEQGREAGMAWLGRRREGRLDPLRAFAPCRSVFSFLVPHELAAPDPSPRVGNIARYALGDDYHEVVKRRLHALLDRLRELEPGLHGRAFVDTAPLLEKVAAARAGLGWQGKHTNLIREGTGSWFLLGEVLLDREVPEPAPATDRCGTCTDCITACPTGAIVAPYQLDSRLCISYLTIEHRGPIPEPLRPLVGNRIFGCDDCQEVCPWNRFARQTELAELRARPDLRERSLVEWMTMDRETWQRTFRRSAVKRARHEGFRRNVAVALGNSGDPEARAVLERERAGCSPLVREHVDWALSRLPRE